tara:strand:+ start:49 stop:702 length:654 start_codon:yes stop_codon:yes gene_type:complete
MLLPVFKHAHSRPQTPPRAPDFKKPLRVLTKYNNCTNVEPIPFLTDPDVLEAVFRRENARRQAENAQRARDGKLLLEKYGHTLVPFECFDTAFVTVNRGFDMGNYTDILLMDISFGREIPSAWTPGPDDWLVATRTGVSYTNDFFMSICEEYPGNRTGTREWHGVCPSRAKWQAVVNWVLKVRPYAWHWVEEHQKKICAPDGKGRKRDLEEFEKEFV